MQATDVQNEAPQRIGIANTGSVQRPAASNGGAVAQEVRVDNAAQQKSGVSNAYADEQNIELENSSVTVPASGKGVPAGGTSGQVLTKNSDEDYDAKWEDPSAGGMPALGNGLYLDADGRLAVDVVNAVESDNTRPITSAAVAVSVGNIEVLLSTI